MIASPLHQKIAAIQPPDAQVVPGQGTVIVAVLKPDTIPEDVITANDVFWTKCLTSKSVAILLTAFKKVDARSIKLLQGSTVLEESQLISTLTTIDGLCAVEAVLDIELGLRLSDSRVTGSPVHLQDITQNTVNHTSMSQSRRENRNYGNLYPGKQLVSKLYQRDWLILAWTDFTFERREAIYRGKGTERQGNRSFLELGIVQEWAGFNPQQRQYFVDRVHEYDFASIEDHRAFWIYYYDRFYEQENQLPHASFETTVAFFRKTLKAWNAESYSSLSKLRQSVKTQRHILQVSPLPAKSSLPHPAPEALPNKEHEKQATTKRIQYLNNPGSPIIQSTQREPSRMRHETSPASAKSHDYDEQIHSKEAATPRINMSELFEGRSVEQLESGVAKGLGILESIKISLESEQSHESDHWLSLVSNLEKQSSQTRTIVGVVGATGAGKSSVINAVLDEERLVPTNCMRACTAVVTEISYNHQGNLYRAEVDFINQSDWLRDLQTSFRDLLDGSGRVSREYTTEDSEAGIAYAKIKAVYPLMTREMMEKTSVEQLMTHPNVKDLLGSSRFIEHEDPGHFYKKLQQYVDSKEKGSRDKKDEAEKARTRNMEYWPLIRVVRLFVRAPVLANGAVIVDLPGVHDSNQARAAVAQNYLKQCTGLWVVAPITRAVDDKSAKTLLGESFKRQLKMDGGYNSVTFICSKTDDISLTEAQDSLGLDEEVAPIYRRSEEIRKSLQKLKQEHEILKATKSDINAATEAADEQLELWEKLSEDFDNGRTVYAPQTQNGLKKRKRDDDDERPGKKSKYAEDSEDDFVADDSDYESQNNSDSQAYESGEDEAPKPLTAEAIDEKVTELKATKKEGRRQRAQVDEQLREIRVQITKIKKEQDMIDSDLIGRCIRGRNEYSRGAIRQHFAAGIRELDQEIAEEDDAANFNPEADVRDYDAVAKSLPVFCVSSRGYQKLMGRLVKDKGFTSFQNVDETEVPALQAHCQSLTLKSREASSKRFLNNLNQLLNSLRLWSTSDGVGPNLSDAQLKREAQILESRLDRLDTDIERIVAGVCTDIGHEIQEHVYEKCSTAISAGEREAIDIQARWGAQVNRQDRSQGGLFWATYKATVRRDGKYNDNHFNDDLIEPVIKVITPGWEKTFSRRLPQVMSNLANQIYNLLVVFHKDVEKRAIANGSSVAAFRILHQQLSTYREVANDASNSAKDFITNQQKDINRQFVPAIEQAMLGAYAVTTAESGPGSYMRMKNAMREHVDSAKHRMFNDSVQHVKESLQRMLKDVQELALVKIDAIFLAIKRDYQSVVLGSSHTDSRNTVLSSNQRKARKKILTTIDTFEMAMKAASGFQQAEILGKKLPSDNAANQSDDNVSTEDMSAVENEPVQSTQDDVQISPDASRSTEEPQFKPEPMETSNIESILPAVEDGLVGYSNLFVWPDSPDDSNGEEDEAIDSYNDHIREMMEEEDEDESDEGDIPY